MKLIAKLIINIHLYLLALGWVILFISIPLSRIIFQSQRMPRIESSIWD